MTIDTGTRVRVTIRNGRVVEGVLLDAWRLGRGGWSVTVDSGHGRRDYTTVEPIVVVDVVDSAEHTDTQESA
jgi:hypothetical protein